MLRRQGGFLRRLDDKFHSEYFLLFKTYCSFIPLGYDSVIEADNLSSDNT
jgi:hypothetical protein